MIYIKCKSIMILQQMQVDELFQHYKITVYWYKAGLNDSNLYVSYVYSDLTLSLIKLLELSRGHFDPGDE